MTLDTGQRLPIKDHAGRTLEWVTAAEARALMAGGKVEILGTRRRVRALRVRMADPAMEERRFQIRRAGLGAPHRRETAENPRGCWTLDPLWSRSRLHFLQVVAECRGCRG